MYICVYCVGHICLVLYCRLYVEYCRLYIIIMDCISHIVSYSMAPTFVKGISTMGPLVFVGGS